MVSPIQRDSIVATITYTVSWIFLLTPLLRPVLGQGCTAFTCFECLNLGCAWFPVISENEATNNCLDICNGIPDAPCYNDEIYVNEDYESICARAETDIPDWTACSAATDCTSCVGSMQTDGVTPCSWYSERLFCGSGLCTDSGCGAMTCDGLSAPVAAPAPTTEAAPSSPSGVCNMDAATCEECLIATISGVDIGTDCGWSTNQCIDSCSLVPGVSCYSSAIQSNSTPAEICALVESASIDDNLCSMATECMNCTGLVQTDGTTSCLWFEGIDTDVNPYCGAHNTNFSIAQVDTSGCDLNGICGVSDCSNVNATTGNLPTVAPIVDTSNEDGSPNAAPTSVDTPNAVPTATFGAPNAVPTAPVGTPNVAPTTPGTGPTPTASTSGTGKVYVLSRLFVTAMVSLWCLPVVMSK